MKGTVIIFTIISDTHGSCHSVYQTKQKIEHVVVMVQGHILFRWGWLLKYKAYVNPKSHIASI